MSPAVFLIGGHAALHHSHHQALCIQLIFSADYNRRLQNQWNCSQH
jgi:hypothetical protein